MIWSGLAQVAALVMIWAIDTLMMIVFVPYKSRWMNVSMLLRNAWQLAVLSLALKLAIDGANISDDGRRRLDGSDSTTQSNMALLLVTCIAIEVGLEILGFSIVVASMSFQKLPISMILMWWNP